MVKRTRKFSDAYHAMKDIGISEDKVKPVLNKLVKLYGRNWELIEAENYRALADAIFEREETEATEHSNKIVNNKEGDEMDQPLKRLRRRIRDGQTSSKHMSNNRITTTPLIRPKEEYDESPETAAENIVAMSEPETCQSLGKNKGKQPVVLVRGDPVHTSGVNGSHQNTPLRPEPVHPMRLRDRGVGPISSQIPSKEKKLVTECSSRDVRLTEANNRITTTPLIRPKEDYDESPETAAENIVANSEPETCQSLGRNKGKQPVVHVRGDPVHTSVVNGSHQNTPLRPEQVHPMRLRDRGVGLTSSQIPSKEKKLVTECSSRDVHLTEPKVEFLSPKEKISARRVLIKPKDEPITDDNSKAPIEVTHPDPSNGGDPSSRDGSIRKDYGREPTIHSRKQLEKANGTASSNESRNKGKVAMPSASDNNGIVDGLELNKMATRVESLTVNGKKEGNAELISKNLVTPETIRSLPNAVDIAKGQEKVVITIANEVNDEKPPHFYYIPRNAIFQDAYVNVSLARIGDRNCCGNCDGDCLSLETPCVCSYETGGQFAYTADGLVKEELLKESISMNRDPEKHCQFFCKECPLERSKNEDTLEPCKGHLVRRFIKECWLKCGCDQLCGNRVVQRGISRKLQVFMTPKGKGWGLRTLEDLPKGAFVCEYVGEVLTNAELFDRVLRKPEGERHSYPVLLDADWCAEGVLKDEDALCLDATYYGNVARFINHRCHDSNLVEIPVEVETPDHHYYHLAFFTTRKVKAMEELTWDYGIDFDDIDHPIKAFRCHCGSKFCRNIKRFRSRGTRR